MQFRLVRELIAQPCTDPILSSTIQFDDEVHVFPVANLTARIRLSNKTRVRCEAVKMIRERLLFEQKLGNPPQYTQYQYKGQVRITQKTWYRTLPEGLNLTLERTLGAQ
jgi:hypothetical protein